MNRLYLIIAFLTFATLLDLTHTRVLAPGDDVIPSLDNPCVTTGGTGSSGITSELLHDALKELQTRCSEGMDSVRILTNLLGRRIQSPFLKEMIRNRHVPAFPYPGNLSFWERGQQIEPILEKDNWNYQKMELFLKRMLVYETKTHNGELTRAITDSLNKLYAILCLIQRIGASESYQYARNTTIPVLSVSVLSDASVAIHDYVIVRDLGDVLDVRRHTYANMTSYLGH